MAMLSGITPTISESNS